jgi:hypothetical protein
VTRPGTVMRREWWHDHREIAALIAWLAERGEIPDDVAYLVEKPWKWTPEYQRMLNEQRAQGVVA